MVAFRYILKAGHWIHRSWVWEQKQKADSNFQPKQMEDSGDSLGLSRLAWRDRSAHEKRGPNHLGAQSGTGGHEKALEIHVEVWSRQLALHLELGRGLA